MAFITELNREVSHVDELRGPAHTGRTKRRDRLLTARAERPSAEPDAPMAGWTQHAMCHDKTAIFFAPPGERDGRRRRREELARAYCACCPVKELCKEAGREGHEHGIWGGENDEERAGAGYAPKSPHRRAVARAAREAREAQAGTNPKVTSKQSHDVA